MKGGNEVLEAFLKLNIPKVKLTIITSDFDAERLKKNLNKNVQVFGIQNKEKMIELYLSHQVLVFPTKIDAFGLVCCEAMLCGMLVIGSDYFAVPEILGEENRKFVVKKDNKNYLVEIMRYCCTNYTKLSKTIEANKKRAEKLFDWNVVAMKMFETMSELYE